jgi:hypothetical protein
MDEMTFMRNASRPEPEPEAGGISRYPADGLKAFMIEVMIRLGASDADAAATASALNHADLCGVDSHGINFVYAQSCVRPGTESWDGQYPAQSANPA